MPRINDLISTRCRRIALAVASFIFSLGVALWLIRQTETISPRIFTHGDLMIRILLMPSLFAAVILTFTSALAAVPANSETISEVKVSPIPAKRFTAQVVGVQWLNPLQRRDYPTEWQLLWTLGLVKPNKDDDMLKAEPELFSRVRAVASIANGNKGKESFRGFHEKYLNELVIRFHDIYFSDSGYFYNVHSVKDKRTWRELAGIHVEYALPEGRLDPVEAEKFTRKTMVSAFSIGNPAFPDSWTRSTPPDIKITMGGPNAGFMSLAAGLDYLQAHPKETVWVMNWDAPSFPPKDEQINENIVLLVLAGPDYNTERAPLAWISYPATRKNADFEAKKGLPSRPVQAWQAILSEATKNAGKQNTDIGFVIHDANNTHPASSDRLASLAQTLTTELVEFDFMKQTFNTPALLGEMGAGTALTNVALGIAYANHLGKHVLVAGTSDATESTGVLVTPPAKVRPIDPAEPWFRARGGNTIFLPWWGLRHDASPGSQGYSR
jgi:hypothetical protein